MAEPDPDSVIDRIFNPQQKSAEQLETEDVAKIIKEWLDPKHIDKKTRYTPQQVVAISILQSLADTYNIKTLKRFLKEFKKGKLSEGGKSASELENILKSRVMDEDEGHLKSLAKFLE
jgi:uncharacterized Rmd1/YagE family protein